MKIKNLEHGLLDISSISTFAETRNLVYMNTLIIEPGIAHEADFESRIC